MALPYAGFTGRGLLACAGDVERMTWHCPFKCRVDLIGEGKGKTRRAEACHPAGR